MCPHGDANDGAHVVVIGATGNVGTSLLDALSADQGISSITGVARRLPRFAPPGIHWLPADIRTDELVRHFRGKDAVVHLGWIFQPTRDPVTTWRNNVLGSLRVFDAVAEAGVDTLVYASSIGAYSPAAGDGPVDESWPTHGWAGAAYTREKAYLERCLDRFESDHPGTRVVRLRPGFLFKRESAAQQRRLFAGPLLPRRLVRPEALPVVPAPAGLVLQATHTDDVAEAYRLAIHSPATGAFNVAAEPPLDGPGLAELFGARQLRVPARAARSVLATLWKLHAVPASPELFDAVLRLPRMDTTRVRNELGWSPRYDTAEALSEMITGMRRGAGAPTPPLEPRVAGGRAHEIATGVGSRQ